MTEDLPRLWAEIRAAGEQFSASSQFGRLTRALPDDLSESQLRAVYPLLVRAFAADKARP
jgi:hypothetical protein